MKRRRRSGRRREAWLAATAALAGFLLLRALLRVFAPGPGVRLLAEWAGTLLFALLPALYGLRRAARPLPSGSPEPRHILVCAACGAFALFPVLLLSALVRGIFRLPRPSALPGAWFLPALLLSALVLPAARGLLERGLLAGLLRGRAALILPACFFALTGGAAAEAPGRFLLALTLGAAAERLRSLQASVLMHAAFGASAVLAECAGPGGALSGGTLDGTLVLIAGCLAWLRALRALAACEPCKAGAQSEPWRRLRPRERAALIAAPVLAAAAPAVCLLLTGGFS